MGKREGIREGAGVEEMGLGKVVGWRKVGERGMGGEMKKEKRFGGREGREQKEERRGSS